MKIPKSRINTRIRRYIQNDIDKRREYLKQIIKQNATINRSRLERWRVGCVLFLEPIPDINEVKYLGKRKPI